MAQRHTILSTNNKYFAVNAWIEFTHKSFFSKEIITLYFQGKNNILKVQRASYKFSEVTNFKEVDEEITEINKTVGGTVGGAVIGTLIAGPFGALVGGMAGGNKKKDKKKSSTYAIEFNNDEWVVFKLKFNMEGKLEVLNFKKSFPQFFEENKENPFQ